MTKQVVMTGHVVIRVKFVVTGLTDSAGILPDDWTGDGWPISDDWSISDDWLISDD